MVSVSAAAAFTAFQTAAQTLIGSDVTTVLWQTGKGHGRVSCTMQLHWKNMHRWGAQQVCCLELAAADAQTLLGLIVSWTGQS